MTKYKSIIASEPYMIGNRRDVPVGVPLDLYTPTGMSCIGTYGEKVQVRQCVKISCFISCFSSIMA